MLMVYSIVLQIKTILYTLSILLQYYYVHIPSGTFVEWIDGLFQRDLVGDIVDLVVKEYWVVHTRHEKDGEDNNEHELSAIKE